MSMYKTKKLLPASASQIPAMAESIRADFAANGYDVKIEMTSNSGCDISLSKGGMFKAVLGLRTALKINMVPMSNGVMFNAGIGIFGQQVIPLAVAWFVAWPVLITQIWGAVQQSKLDERALADAERVILGSPQNYAPQPTAFTSTSNPVSNFCTNCGTPISTGAKFCPNCGNKIG